MLVASISASLTARSAAARSPRAQAWAIAAASVGEPVLGHHPIVAREKSGIEGQPGPQRGERLRAVSATMVGNSDETTMPLGSRPARRRLRRAARGPGRGVERAAGQHDAVGDLPAKRDHLREHRRDIDRGCRGRRGGNHRSKFSIRPSRPGTARCRRAADRGSPRPSRAPGSAVWHRGRRARPRPAPCGSTRSRG